MTKTPKKASTAGASARKSRKPRASVSKPEAASRIQTHAPILQRAPSKQQQLAALVVRDEGATLDPAQQGLSGFTSS